MEYMTNEKGERTRVVLSIDEYEELVEAREELADIAAHDEAVSELASGEDERIPWEESKRRRKERASGSSRGSSGL